MTATHPLTGFVVIDFTHVLAGPACSYYLGLLGAQVIKVESVEKGDAIRHRGGTDHAAAARGMSTSYLTQGAGKQSITLDLDTDEGRGVMQRLLAQADIFVENHVPKTMKTLGLDEHSVSTAHPHVIHCAMTGYGRGGTQENAPAYDVNIQASCGIMEATGTAESGPIRTGAPILDYATGLAAAFAVSAALVEREKTGQGSFIDVSMLETGLTLMSSSITDFKKTGNPPKRRGNLANSRSPGAGSFPCKSGIISLGVNEESHFQNLAHALGRSDWLEDERFSERTARKAHADEFAQQIEVELAKKPAAEWELILQDAGVPSAQLRSLPEALASEHVLKRGFVQTLSDGVAVPTLPFRIGGAASYHPNRAAPLLGDDTTAVMEWLVAAESRR
ncbi:MAG: CoA transferase [Pseudomonadota bacterium]